MRIKEVFSVENGVRIVVEVDGVERAVLRSVYGYDICESRYKIIRLMELLNNLRATLALYRSGIGKFDTGCITVLSEDGEGWSMVKSLCSAKGFEEDRDCADYVVTIATDFLHTLASFQQV